ncbi:hypothetical protein ABZP36_012279 [Zizania latifolia]
MEEVSNGVESELVGLRCFDGTVLIISATAWHSRFGSRGHGDGIVDYWRCRDGAEDASKYDVEFATGLKHDELVDLICAAHHMADLQLFQSSSNPIFGATNLR